MVFKFVDLSRFRLVVAMRAAEALGYLLLVDAHRNRNPTDHLQTVQKRGNLYLATYVYVQIRRYLLSQPLDSCDYLSNHLHSTNRSGKAPT